MVDEQVLHEKLVNATESVLETMFFTAVLERVAVENARGPFVQVHVPFLGYPSGELRIAIEESAARVMTQDFLPDAEVETASIEETMREFANMTCGAFLSEIESDSGFKLLSPVIQDADGGSTLNGPSVEEGFMLESGNLIVGVRFAYE